MSTQTSKTNTLKAVKDNGGGMHGTDYQLKITLWSVLIAKQNVSNHKYSKYSITPEDPLGGKFDDTVLHFQLPDGSNQSLYIQAKHKYDNEYRIKSRDLRSTSDDTFSMKKYFKSFKNLHTEGKTNGARFVLCTNAGVSQDVEQILENIVYSSTDDIAAIFNRVKETKIYRFNMERLGNIVKFKNFFDDLIIDENDDVLLDQFFAQFLLISNMKGTEIINDTIKLWRDMDVPGGSLFTQQMGLIEEAIALDHLSNVAWKMTNFSESKSETDIDQICQAIVRNLCFLQLKGVTSIFCKSFENNDVRIKSEALEQSKAYRACLTGGVLEYCSMLDTEVSCNIMFQIVQLVKSECFSTNSKPELVQPEYIFTDAKTYSKIASVIKDIFCFLECNLVLVIVCEKDTAIISRSVDELFKDSETKSKKTVILITTSEEQYNEEEFRVSDLTQLAKETIFENYSQVELSYALISLENLVNQEDNLAFALRLIKTVESAKFKTHPCIESFKKIETLYINRSWKTSTTIDRDNYSWSEAFFFWDNYSPESLRHLKKPIGFKQLAGRMGLNLFACFTKTTNHAIQQVAEKVYTPAMDTSDRVIIFLDDAGFGKTTYMTWVAWYFVVHRKSSWVIRLNAIEYSFDFGQILKDYGLTLDDNKAIRILFQLIYLAVSIPNLATKTMDQTDAERLKVKRWAECLSLSEGKVVVNCTRDATVEQKIALMVFREKFKEKQIVLLLDGFDEIAPHYKQVVLNLFSHFAQFEGIHKLYFTSRPYNFIDELRHAFRVTDIYRIDPFSNENQYEFLHKYLGSNFKGYEGCVGTKRKCLWEILLEILKTILGELLPIPLFFTMALDILTPRLREKINFINYTISPTLFQELQTMFGRSRILEAFVNLKLAIANDKKFVSCPSAGATAQAQLDAEELNELNRNNLSLLAIYTIIPSYYELVTRREQQQCEQYLKKIEDGREKCGIIEGVQGGVPLWIHRMFAEYFAAHWLFENSDRHEVVLYFKSMSYWDLRNIAVRKIFDEIAIRDNDGNDSPVHLAIIRNDEIRLKNALTKNVHQQKDTIGRTPLHLAVQYFGKMENNRYQGHSIPGFAELLLTKIKKSQKSLLIHAKDDLLDWSALDYAFHIGTIEAIKYLLEHNAPIDATVLLEQLKGLDPSDSSEKLARCDRYVMDSVHNIDNHKPRFRHSRKQIETMRTVCKNVITHIKNKHREWFEGNKTNMLLMCAKRDSVLLLRSLLASETDLITASNQATVIAKALKHYSFYILGFLIHEQKIDISAAIDEDRAYKLLRYSLENGYKKWFAYFFNLCSTVLNISGRTQWDACDSNMVELLSYVMYYGSPKQLQKLFNTVLLAIDVQFVFAFLSHVASFPDLLKFTKGIRILVDRTENLYDSDEAGCNLLHRSAQLGLFEMVKYLIEYKQFNAKTVNPRSNWNAFHYCVSVPLDWTQLRTAKEGCYESFQYMMQDSVINVFDKEGKSVFYLAVVNEHFRIAKHILDMVLATTLPDNRSSKLREYIESSNLGGRIERTEFLRFLEEVNNK
ncbi:uncharacterized protein LOC126570929 [Anopheles aquasalis]|uniref:uncharacterized protein LOC126570929 n=1 Tax=Anopheles aquasalis TaxID=42839 RepID=UPI00215AAA8B|nr:uncharacterized protein LOC126570929 [Anopheles aquasalis]